ncbi:MAG: ATP-binding protein [Candidatus Woesearchaeota archaeon]
MFLEDLERFNTWWTTGSVRKELLKPYKRKLYFEVQKYIKKRQIVMIYGLRRVGKTTLLLQIIDELLKNNNPKNILFFSFDEKTFDVKEVLEFYQKNVLNKTFDEIDNKIYVFFDEIQKVDDWENKLKVYYDLYPKIKFFISSSASLKLRKKSRESLSGRIIDFLLKPLSFEEFLEMLGKDLKSIKKNINLWKRELMPLFYKFVKFGMFPELVFEEDEEFARRYLLESVVERIIYKDILEELYIKDVELLKKLIYIIARNPGMLVNFERLAEDLGRDKRTIANYFEYLEFSLLVKFVFNYRESQIASYRKLKKAYFATPNLIFALNPNFNDILPKIIENVVLVHSEARFFFRNSFEVDFLLEENTKIIGVEVKLNANEVSQLKKFVLKFKSKVKDVFIIDLEEEKIIDEIRVVPIWKWLLIQK